MCRVPHPVRSIELEFHLPKSKRTKALRPSPNQWRLHPYFRALSLCVALRVPICGEAKILPALATANCSMCAVVPRKLLFSRGARLLPAEVPESVRSLLLPPSSLRAYAVDPPFVFAPTVPVRHLVPAVF